MNQGIESKWDPLFISDSFFIGYYKIMLTIKLIQNLNLNFWVFLQARYV